MHSNLLDLLICPDCRNGRLELQKAELQGDEILAGQIFCKTCNHNYPIKAGIPCLLSDDLLTVQENPGLEQLIKNKRELEKKIVDEDLATFKEFYKAEARKLGIRQDMDKYVWEKIMHLDNQCLRDDLGTEKASKWVVTKNNLQRRNERIFHILNEVDHGNGGFAGKLALNIGVGIDDDLVHRLQTAGTEVINSDLILDTLIQLKLSNAAQCVTSDIKRLPFEEGTFDFVLCFLVLHHIDAMEKALTELNRVLKPGGTAFILEMNPYTIIKLPGKLFTPRLKRIARKGMRRYLAKSEQRLFKSTPYEKMYPSRMIISSMGNVGFSDINRKVVTNSPPFIPKFISAIWDNLANTLPFFFDPVALEFLFWGKKHVKELENR